MRRCMTSVRLTKHLPTNYYDGRVNDDEMSRTCGTQGGEEKCIQGVGGETQKKKKKEKQNGGKTNP
jgi:hypothetical protein